MIVSVSFKKHNNSDVTMVPIFVTILCSMFIFYSWDCIDFNETNVKYVQLKNSLCYSIITFFLRAQVTIYLFSLIDVADLQLQPLPTPFGLISSQLNSIYLIYILYPPYLWHVTLFFRKNDWKTFLNNRHLQCSEYIVPKECFCNDVPLALEDHGGSY